MSEFRLSEVGIALLERIPKSFPEQLVKVNYSANPIITIVSPSKVIGELFIDDDEYEATVHVGNITHGHFSCYIDDVSPTLAAANITDNVAQFLHGVFADRIAFFRFAFGGGWSPTEEATGKYWVWSGKLD